MLPIQILLLAIARLGLSAEVSPFPRDGSDLCSFVSRPDIRAPRFNVSTHRPDLVTPGYWFTAPYGDLRTRLPTTLYQPAQVGPHIYDGNGELVWGGAHLFDDRPIFDFKVADVNGTPHLTFITNEDLHELDSPGGAAVVLDSSYRRVQELEDHAGRGTMNMHEFNMVDGGRRALTITFESKLTDLTVDGRTQKTFIGNNGFSEIDIETGETIFVWWALDHIDPNESLVEKPSSVGSYGSPWDAYHINSVDKNEEGDYLVSARYTSTIYKISGTDGHIKWRLGGSKSDFALQGFNMSSQHDARFQSDNGTTTVITFFDNHSDGHHFTAKTSAAVEVALDHDTGKARVLNQWTRPDGGLTKLRGNAQRLQSGNMFVCWSENSYMSEHTPDGELVMEAQMASHRLVTYRAYKMNFTAQPNEPIAVKAFVYGVEESSSTTVVYVSWNGATEVRRWAFYRVQDGTLHHLGVAERTGFETMFMVSGANRDVVCEALDEHGTSLGKSAVSASELPSAWRWDKAIPQLMPLNADEAAHGVVVESNEKTSLSEDLSAQLHEQAEELSQKNGLRAYSAISTNPLILVGIATMSLCGTLVALLAKARHRRSNRPELGKYSGLTDEA